jgi:hypothetical protein
MPNLYCLVSNNTMTIDLSNGGRPKYVYPFTFTTETFQLNNIGHNVIPLEVDTSVEPVKIIVNEMTCDFPGKDFDYSQLSPFLRLQFKLRENKRDDPRYLFDVLYDYSIFQLLPSGETKVLYQSNWVETGKGEEKGKERSWSVNNIHSFSLVDGQILNA